MVKHISSKLAKNAIKLIENCNKLIKPITVKHIRLTVLGSIFTSIRATLS